MKCNTTVLALILSFSTFSAFAGEQPKTQVTTTDNRVIYSTTDNRLIGVQKQTVCTTQADGKQKCFERAVATLVPK
jgi:hypothetical protein